MSGAAAISGRAEGLINKKYPYIYVLSNIEIGMGIFLDNSNLHMQN
jgi:hypothetical protein